MIYVVYGHSGSGKTTLVDNLVKQGILPRVKTITTRPKRHPNEGDYEFVHIAEFMRMEAQGNLLGIRNFKTFYEDSIKVFHYGIPIDKLKPFASDNNHCVIIADAKGVEELFEYFGSDFVIGVYMYGPKELLKDRASSRDDYLEREWERRYEADNATLSLEEFIRNASGDKFITGYRYFLVSILLSPDEQVEYFKEIVLNG